MNCHVGYCADECTTKDDIELQFQLARQNCEAEEAGAVLMIGGKQYEFTNDADLEPPSRIKRGVRSNILHQSIPKRQEPSVSSQALSPLHTRSSSQLNLLRTPDSTLLECRTASYNRACNFPSEVRGQRAAPSRARMKSPNRPQ